jgi:hypothetical protein
MKMKTSESFDAYLVRFLRVVNQVDNMRTNDKQKMFHLRRLITMSLQAKVSGYSSTTGTFDGLVEELRTHSRNLDAIRAALPSSTARAPRTAKPSSKTNENNPRATIPATRRPNALFKRAKLAKVCANCGKKTEDAKHYPCKEKAITDDQLA